jgi:glycosyltransferase involved in cell wall biosynthesis
MHIALVAPGFSASEADWAIPALQTFAAELSQYHEVHVFSLRYPAAGEYRLGAVRHTAIGGGTRAGVASAAIWRRTVAAVMSAHRQRPFDVLHAFWADEPALVAGLAGRLLRRPVMASLAGGELVHLADIGYGTAGSPVRRQLVRLALGLADAVTAGSAYLRDLAARRGVPAAKIRRLPLGIDATRFRPEPEPDGPPTLIQAASLTPVKNQALLLEVFAAVRERVPQARLVVAGAGPVREALAAQARRLGLEGRVAWLAAVAYPEMPAALGQGHVYLQSSRHEAQGMAVLEAAACGLPALGTPVGILPEVAAAPASDDPAVLAEGAAIFLADPARREAWRLRARAHAAEFALGTATGRFADLYAELATGPAEGAAGSATPRATAGRRRTL